VLDCSHVVPRCALVNDFLWHELVVHPVACNLLTVGLDEAALAIHHVIGPLPDVLISVCKHLSASAFDFVFSEVSIVLGAVLPGHVALSMHHVVLELALVYFLAVVEEVLAFAVELVFHEVALVDITVELKPALACFVAFNEVAGVNNLAELPGLSSFAVLEVFFPVAIIHRTLVVDVDAVSVSFAVFPLTPVDATVWVCHLALAMKLPIHSHALVHGPICEVMSTQTLNRVLESVLRRSPLTLILLLLVDWKSVGVPVVTLATSLGVNLVADIAIAEQTLVRDNALAVDVGWLLDCLEQLELYQPLEASSGKCTKTPPVNHLLLVGSEHELAVFVLESHVLLGSAATHLCTINFKPR